MESDYGLHAYVIRAIASASSSLVCDLADVMLPTMQAECSLTIVVILIIDLVTL
jgi:hypothetical protein